MPDDPRRVTTSGKLGCDRWVGFIESLRSSAQDPPQPGTCMDLTDAVLAMVVPKLTHPRGRGFAPRHWEVSRSCSATRSRASTICMHVRVWFRFCLACGCGAADASELFVQTFPRQPPVAGGP